MFWDGETLKGNALGMLVIAVAPTALEGFTQPFGFISGKEGDALVLPDRWEMFLVGHKQATFITLDAAHAHWLLHGWLKARGWTQGSSVLWQLTSDSRLVDLLFVEQAIRRAGGEWNPVPLPQKHFLEQNGQSLACDGAGARQACANLAAPESERTIKGLLRTAKFLRSKYIDYSPECRRLVQEARGDSRLPEWIYAPATNADRQRTQVEEEDLRRRLKERRDLRKTLLRNATQDSGEPGRSVDDRGQQGTAEEDEFGTAVFPDPREPFGTLGTGLEVQSAVVREHLASRHLRIDEQGWRILCSLAQAEYEKVSERLGNLSAGRGGIRPRNAFAWQQSPHSARASIERDQWGQPKRKPQQFVEWLRSFSRSRVDLYGCCSTRTPQLTACTPPEGFYPWTLCIQELHDWHKLEQLAAILAIVPRGEQIRLTYLAGIAGLQARTDFTTIACLHPCIRPADQQVFLRIRHHDLGLWCLANLGLRLDYMGMQDGLGWRHINFGWTEATQIDFMGSIAAMLFARHQCPEVKALERRCDELENRLDQLVELECPTPELPGRTLFPEVTNPDSDEVLQAMEAVRLAQQEYQKAANHQEQLRAGFRSLGASESDQDRQTYDRWLHFTQVFLTALPLHENATLLKKHLQLARVELDFDENTLLEIRRYVGGNYVQEIGGFASDDSFERLAEILELPTGEVCRILGTNSDPLFEQEGFYRAINDSRSVSRLYRKLGALQHSLTQESSRMQTWPAFHEFQEIVMGLTQLRALSPGGRPVGPDPVLLTRAEQYLRTQEEVLIITAYTLLKSGYDLVAVSGSDLFVEVRDDTTLSGQIQIIQDICQTAQARLLRVPVPLSIKVVRP